MIIELVTRDNRPLARFDADSATVYAWYRADDPIIVRGRAYAIVTLEWVDSDPVPKIRVGVTEIVLQTVHDELRAHRLA